MERNRYIEAVRAYGNTIFRVAYQYCGNKADAEDIVQNTFLKLLQSEKVFADEEYLKRWLIRVAINDAKNVSISFWKRKVLSIKDMLAEQVDETAVCMFNTEEHQALHEAVMYLPAKYRIVVHLYYFEDYSVKEIAEIINIKETTVQTQLMRARAKLKEQLKEAWKDE